MDRTDTSDDRMIMNMAIIDELNIMCLIVQILDSCWTRNNYGKLVRVRALTSA